MVKYARRITSRSSRRAGARDMNSRKATNEIAANRTDVACHPPISAAVSSPTMTHHEPMRLPRSLKPAPA